MSFREELQGITSQKSEESKKERQKLEEELSRRFDEGVEELIDSIVHGDIIIELKVKAISGSKADILLEYPDKLKKVFEECLEKGAWHILVMDKIEEAVTKNIEQSPELAEVYRRALPGYYSDNVRVEFSWEDSI